MPIKNILKEFNITFSITQKSALMKQGVDDCRNN